MASIMRRWMETDHAEFEIDQELKIGPDAGKLDDAPVLPIFSRQDVEHEFRRWRWEAARHSNIVVIAALMIVGGLMAGVGDEFSTRVCFGIMAALAFVVGIFNIVVMVQMVGWTTARRRTIAHAQQWIHLIGACVVVALLTATVVAQGTSCPRGQATGEAESCTRTAHASDAAAYFALHFITRNPRLSAAASTALVVLSIFVFPANSDFGTADIAVRTLLFLVMNFLFVITVSQYDAVIRAQFRSILQLEDAFRMHAAHRDRLAYIVRRALPPRFANRLSKTMATSSVLPLHELYDHSLDATLCMTRVSGFSDWSTQQLQESGVLALHRLFTWFDDGVRIFGVDPSGVYGDAYLVTGRLIRGSHCRTARVIRFALWQLHARFNLDVDDDLTSSSIRRRSARTGGAGSGNRRGANRLPSLTAPQNLYPGGDSDDSVLRALRRQAIKLHSVVMNGPLSGGMTGTRELRYFLSGATLRHAEAIIGMVPAGSLWASKSAIDALASAIVDETGKFIITPAHTARTATDALRASKHDVMFSVAMPRHAMDRSFRGSDSDSSVGSMRSDGADSDDNSLRPPSFGDQFSADSVLNAAEERQRMRARLAPSSNGRVYGDNATELFGAEPDLADVAQMILANEPHMDGINPLDPDMEIAASVARTFTNRQASTVNGGMSSIRGAFTNVLSVPHHAARYQLRHRPTLNTCSGTIADRVEEDTFVSYAKHKAARGYPAIALAFALFFLASVCLVLPLRFAESTHNSFYDIAAYAAAGIGFVLSLVTFLLARRHTKSQRRMRARILYAQKRRIAAANGGRNNSQNNRSQAFIPALPSPRNGAGDSTTGRDAESATCPSCGRDRGARCG